MLKQIYLLIFLPVLLLANEGVVTQVNDGDTAIFFNDGKYEVCHLGEIDAPEIETNEKLMEEQLLCGLPTKQMVEAGEESKNFAKNILKVGKRYTYEILWRWDNGNPTCKVNVPKGLSVELRETFATRMIEQGYALPFIIKAEEEKQEKFLKLALEAKKQNRGLWKSHREVMQCFVEHRYSLRALR